MSGRQGRHQRCAPSCECRLRGNASSKIFHRSHNIKRIRTQTEAIQTQESGRGHDGCALVSIDKGMRFPDAKSVGSSEILEAGLSMSKRIARSLFCHFKHLQVSHSRSATVSRNLAVMEDQGNVLAVLDIGPRGAISA